MVNSTFRSVVMLVLPIGFITGLVSRSWTPSIGVPDSDSDSARVESPSPAFLVPPMASDEQAAYLNSELSRVHITINSNGESLTIAVKRNLYGTHIIESNAVPIEPAAPAAGYPRLVAHASPLETLVKDGKPVNRHRVTIQFELLGDNLRRWAQHMVLLSPDEYDWLAAHDREDFSVKTALTKSAAIEMTYAGETIAVGCAPAIEDAARFEVQFDLDDDSLARFERGVNDGGLRFQMHALLVEEASGWSWGEGLMRATSTAGATELQELKKRAWRLGNKQTLWLPYFSEGLLRFTTTAVSDSKTNHPDLLANLVPEEFASAFAESINWVSLAELRKENPRIDDAIWEHVRPLIDQRLTSMGMIALRDELRRRIQERRETGGIGVSVPFVGGDASWSELNSLLTSLQETTGTRFQVDETTHSFAPSEVQVRQLKDRFSSTDVHLSKSILIDRGPASHWHTRAPVSVRLTSKAVNEAIAAACADIQRWAAEREAAEYELDAAKDREQQAADGVTTREAALNDAKSRVEPAAAAEAAARAEYTAAQAKLAEADRKLDPAAKIAELFGGDGLLIELRRELNYDSIHEGAVNAARVLDAAIVALANAQKAAADTDQAVAAAKIEQQAAKEAAASARRKLENASKLSPMLPKKRVQS